MQNHSVSFHKASLKPEGTLIHSAIFFFRCFTYILFLFFSSKVFCQQNKKSVEYTPDFKFKEGIYITFDQVLKNKPVYKTRIITKIDANDFEYFVKVLSGETIQYFDDYGIQQTVKINDVWGYCRKGMIFINWQGEFNRIPVIGSISYFAAVVSVSGTRFPDTFDSFYPTMSSPDSQQEEMRQYLIDFETGMVLDYNFENVVEMLKKDNELYEEYKSLKKRKKKNMTFVYVRKYNTKHPVFFPVD